MKKVYQGKLAAAKQPHDWSSMTGKDLYEMAGRSALRHAPDEIIDPRRHYPAASQYLRAKGLAGVQYESGKIHQKYQGHRNYASFEAPRILKRYAIPGMLGAGVAGTALAGKGENGS